MARFCLDEAENEENDDVKNVNENEFIKGFLFTFFLERVWKKIINVYSYHALQI